MSTVQKQMTKIWTKLDAECNIAQVIILENELKVKQNLIKATEKRLNELSKQALKDDKEYIQKQENDTTEELKLYKFN